MSVNFSEKDEEMVHGKNETQKRGILVVRISIKGKLLIVKLKIMKTILK